MAFTARVLVLAFVAVFFSGVAHSVAHPYRRQPTDPGTAPSPTRMSARDLEDFEAEVGYSPIVVDGVLVDPSGECPTPGGVGPASFETACMAHDFRYDVLRYADAKRSPLEPLARFEADRLLYEDILHTCRTVRCEASAALYFVAVSANSLRQGYQAPVEEPAIPWLLLTMVVLVVAWAGPKRAFAGSLQALVTRLRAHGRRRVPAPLGPDRLRPMPDVRAG